MSNSKDMEKIATVSDHLQSFLSIRKRRVFWDSIDVRPSVLDPTQDIVVITVRSHDLTFDDLSMISQALGTTHINMDNQVREGGYCDTCRYSYNITVVTVMGAKLNGLEQAAGPAGPSL